MTKISSIINSFFVESTVGEEDLDVTISISLMVRLFEWVKEDAMDDVDIHKLVENIIDSKSDKSKLDMTDYSNLIKLK
jgi:hypothetical protein